MQLFGNPVHYKQGEVQETHWDPSELIIYPAGHVVLQTLDPVCFTFPPSIQESQYAAHFCL